MGAKCPFPALIHLPRAPNPFCPQGAVTAMTKAMAIDESRYGVRVNRYYWGTTEGEAHSTEGDPSRDGGEACSTGGITGWGHCWGKFTALLLSQHLGGSRFLQGGH